MQVEAKVIEPFQNVKRPDRQIDNSRTDNMLHMSVGAGSKAVYMDSRGLWIGARTPTAANTWFDINGNAYLTGYFNFTDNNLDDIDDGGTYSRVLTTSISAGQVLLSATIGDLDDVADGSSYGKVLVTDISAGHILLSSTVGDLDDVPDGTTYGKVLSTGISAGVIVLSATSGSLDDISDGGTYKRVTDSEKTGAGRAYNGLNSSYEIVKGYLLSQLDSVSLPTNGVRIDVNGVYGRKAGATTFYINSSGDAYFSGTVAASTITSPDMSGGTITGTTVRTASSGTRVEMSGTDASRVRFYYSSTLVGFIKANSTTQFQILSGSSSIGLEYLAQDHRFYSAAGGGVTTYSDIFNCTRLDANRAIIEGTAGNGYVEYRKQSSHPATPTNDAVKVYFDGNNNIFFRRPSDGAIASINLTSGTINTYS